MQAVMIYALPILAGPRAETVLTSGRDTHKDSPHPKERVMSKENDSAVIASILQGNLQGFDILVERYQGRIEAFITKFFRSTTHTADLVQEVFLTAYLDLDKLRNTERFKSWVYGIAYRKCLHYSRRRRTETKNMKAVAHSQETSTPAPELPSDPQESTEILGLLDRLSELDALLVWLHYIEELPYDEVADMVDMKSAAIRQRCRRALAHLREATS